MGASRRSWETPTDYEGIREENLRRYGTDVVEYGAALLSERYADQAHFLLEILQNAEDALRQAVARQGPRVLTFRLSDRELRIAHAGRPFDAADVRAICSIAKSSKDALTDIGRFGIGFKAVFAVTDCPEIHSGEEDFGIEHFVWPVARPPVARADGETVIRLPLRDGAHAVVHRGLVDLQPETLLFLSAVDELRWDGGGGSTGRWCRSAEPLDDGVQRVTIAGHTNQHTSEEAWLVFSESVQATAGRTGGQVQVAFRLAAGSGSGAPVIQRLPQSPLAVYFPTGVETKLGFLIQGPYRTTPSRDNVSAHDPWNLDLVRQTGRLVVRALDWLRDRSQLTWEVLACLPLAAEEVPSLLQPLCGAVHEALDSHPWWPSAEGGYVDLPHGRVAHDPSLPPLLSSAQLTVLEGRPAQWVSVGLAQHADLRDYVSRTHPDSARGPLDILRRLSAAFLEAQSDDWVRCWYEWLHDCGWLDCSLDTVPWVRLESGRHTCAFAGDKPQAYLPASRPSHFPLVRRALAGTDKSLRFLLRMGLSEPGLVDEVLETVLPKYGDARPEMPPEEYAADADLIASASRVDSSAQRDRLRAALSTACFIPAVDRTTGDRHFTTPGSVYWPTDQLCDLWEGIPGILFVDIERYPAVEGVRSLSKAVETLRTVLVPAHLSAAQRRALRGDAAWTRDQDGQDVEIPALDAWLARLAGLDQEDRRRQAQLLWDQLAALASASPETLDGTYRWWNGQQERRASFQASFVTTLQSAAWLPGADGSGQVPPAVEFASLGWKPNALLQERLNFASPVMARLAQEAGLEAGVLDLLKSQGIATVHDLRRALGCDLDRRAEAAGAAAPPSIPGVSAEPAPAGARGSATPSGPASGEAAVLAGVAAPAAPSGGRWRLPGADRPLGAGRVHARWAAKRTPGRPGARPFATYVAVSPERAAADPDGLDHEARQALEEAAIAYICDREPDLHRTSANNPGYDLYALDPEGHVSAYIEVKAMTGGLEDRPVGLSRLQFAWARRHGEQFWLYVVERAQQAPSLIKIRNPYGLAQTFTFDRGWVALAAADAASHPP